jgi:hypothetical protein
VRGAPPPGFFVWGVGRGEAKVVSTCASDDVMVCN